MSDFLYSVQGIAAAIGSVLFWFLWQDISTSDGKGFSHKQAKALSGFIFGLLVFSLVHGFQSKRDLEASHKLELEAMPSSSPKFWRLTGSLSFVLPTTVHLYQQDSKALRELNQKTHLGMKSILEIAAVEPRSKVQAAVTQFVESVDAAAKEVRVKDDPEHAELEEAKEVTRARLLNGNWAEENDPPDSDRNKLALALIEFSHLTLEHAAVGSQTRVDFTTNSMTELWDQFEAHVKKGLGD